MLKYITFLFCFLFSYSFLQAQDLVIYKKMDKMFTMTSAADAQLQNAVLDNESNRLSTLNIDEPGLYLFVLLSNNSMRLAYFDKPINTEQYSFNNQDEDIQWLEDNFNYFHVLLQEAENKQWAEEEVLNKAHSFKLAEDYENRLVNISQKYKIVKNFLKTFLQDFLAFDKLMRQKENLPIILSKEDYHFNFFSTGLYFYEMMTNSQLPYLPEDLRMFIKLYNEIVNAEQLTTELMQSYQILLDEQAVLHPDIYKNMREAFHLKINVMSSLTSLPVLDENKNSVYIKDYIQSPYFIIYAWGTWCYPCEVFEKEKMSDLKNIAKKHDITIFSLASESVKSFDLWKSKLVGEKSDLKNFFGFSKFTEGHSGNAMNDIFGNLYISVFPSLILLDKDGNIIIANDPHGEKVLEYLKSL